ncbi:hypothetical protein BU23DRAFT_660359, partial [Bimuria novae-zelandiae CBS 107.79]
MASIYENAYLTLAATKARGCNEGLYNATNNHAPRALNAIGRDGNMLSRYVQRFFPLLSRAWVLQERLLSPRILHFGPAELLWEYCECSTCECRHEETQPADNTPYPKIQYAACLDPRSTESRPTMWRSIAYAYSQLGITYPSDRLPGLRGVAMQLFGDNPRSKVISGLWEDTMLLDLMWEANGENHESMKLVLPNIPSWSWATMATRVRYQFSATRDKS